MSSIEDAVKSLVEFESALDTAKSDALEAKKKLLKDTNDWAEGSKAVAISKAKQVASDRVSKARADAEVEAVVIRRKGAASLQTFQTSISKHKSDAVELVVSALLGERP